MSPTIRNLTAADIVAVRGERLGRTVRGFAAELDGRVVGIAGIVFDPGAPKAFSQFDEVMRRYPVTMVRAARRVLALARRHGLLPIAVVDPTDARGARFVRHLGFRLLMPHEKGDVYQWIP